MKFCEACNNMLYIRVTQEEGSAEPELKYMCKHCASDDVDVVGAEATGSASTSVLDTNYADRLMTYKAYATPMIVHDPTLPRTSDIACPNKTCNRPQGAPEEVIYIKHDFTGLQFLYHCVHCKFFWRSRRDYSGRHE
jgi:DNA-directed RNA polymerase subunit M/transcription elongation factor TFIIS